MITFQRSRLPVDRCTKKEGECPQTVFHGGGARIKCRWGYARLTVVIKNIMSQFACKCHFKISHNLITFIILWYICARISPLTTCDSITTKLRLLVEFWGPLKNNFPKTLGTSGQQGKGWGWGGDHRLNRLTLSQQKLILCISEYTDNCACKPIHYSTLPNGVILQRHRWCSSRILHCSKLSKRP